MIGNKREKRLRLKTEGYWLQIVRYERFADCALEKREPTCEWSKGGRPRAVRNERRGLAHVVKHEATAL